MLALEMNYVRLIVRLGAREQGQSRDVTQPRDNVREK